MAKIMETISNLINPAKMSEKYRGFILVKPTRKGETYSIFAADDPTTDLIDGMTTDAPPTTRDAARAWVKARIEEKPVVPVANENWDSVHPEKIKRAAEAYHSLSDAMNHTREAFHQFNTVQTRRHNHNQAGRYGPPHIPRSMRTHDQRLSVGILGGDWYVREMKDKGAYFGSRQQARNYAVKHGLGVAAVTRRPLTQKYG